MDSLLLLFTIILILIVFIWAQTNYATKTQNPNSLSGKTSTNTNTEVVYRIAGIPSLWDAETVKGHMKKLDPELDVTDAQFNNLFPDCYSPTESHVLLLRVRQPTKFLRKIQKRTPLHQTELSIDIDQDFFDLTPLNMPESPITFE